LGVGKTRNGPNHGPGRYENRNGRNERPIDEDQRKFRCLAGELLLHSHFSVGALEDFRQNASPHLLRLLNAIDVQ
jgi:hypothetical protein